MAALIALLAIGTGSAVGQPAQDARVVAENRRCMNCHGQSHLAELSPRERAAMVAPSPGAEPGPQRWPGLYVPPQTLDASVHAGLACVSCHQGAATLPHPARLERPACATCHTAAGAEFAAGSHGVALAQGDANAPTCVTCHGGHEVLPARDRRSQTHPLNVIQTCGGCHDDFQTTNGNDAMQVGQYLESVHGRALTRAGLAVAATCADCHGAHQVLPSSNPASLVHRRNTGETCGTCHVGVNERFARSIHGELLAAGDERAPVCSDCHTAHAITRIDAPRFFLDIINECGVCHDQPSPTGRTSLYQTYRRGYHGQVTTLGSTRAARCSDCHGAHDVRRVEDPLSRVHSENLLETCQSCHPRANVNFTLYSPHADHRDRERYPILHGVWLYFVIMMSFAFGFFGLHSVLWLGRSVVERVKHGPHPRPKANPHAIKRFNRVDRINHAFVIISFFGLTITGLPLLYSDKAWAVALIETIGGVHAAGRWHRFFAIILILNFLVHLVGVVRRFRRYGIREMLFGPSTMLPRWKDVTDCLGMFRWFFLGGKKPKFDRWTYWEKFDYVAEVGGSVIIGVSGLMLWFPEFFSWYLPGWMFNVTKVVHGFEALLAIGFIFTIHFFNAHLRLEKFPVDDVMFTGSLPEEEFMHERGAEYERLVATGELEALKVAPPPAWYRPVAVLAGLLAMAIGTTLVVLIILAAIGAI